MDTNLKNSPVQPNVASVQPNDFPEDTSPAFSQEEVDAFYEENREMIDYITETVIQNHPDIQRANEVLSSQQQHDCVATAMEEFASEFPDSGISSINDFEKLDDPDKFKSLVENGLSFSDAYKLVNFESLVNAKKSGKGNSPALNQALKGHIKTSGSFDKVSDTPVPSDVLELYKSLCKGWSDEKIKKHFTSSKK